MNIGFNFVLKIDGNSLVLYIFMNGVFICGIFDLGVFFFLEGWKIFRIERYGDMSFFFYGDVRINIFYLNGNFYVEGVIYLRGRDFVVI